MRTDTKALVRVVMWCTAIGVLTMGILAAAAFGAVPRDVAITLAAVCIVGGGIVVGRTFSRALMQR
jgi:hypothetical protein